MPCLLEMEDGFRWTPCYRASGSFRDFHAFDVVRLSVHSGFDAHVSMAHFCFRL